jgi:hypothetical protein
MGARQLHRNMIEIVHGYLEIAYRYYLPRHEIQINRTIVFPRLCELQVMAVSRKRRGRDGGHVEEAVEETGEVK